MKKKLIIFLGYAYWIIFVHPFWLIILIAEFCKDRMDNLGGWLFKNT
jgi:hypothetical protein